MKILHYISKCVNDNVKNCNKCEVKKLVRLIRNELIKADNYYTKQSTIYQRNYKKKLFYFINKIMKIALNQKEKNPQIPHVNLFNHLMEYIIGKRASDYLSFETIAEFEEVRKIGNEEQNLENKNPFFLSKIKLFFSI